jgi:hypothetical protein
MGLGSGLGIRRTSLGQGAHTGGGRDAAGAVWGASASSINAPTPAPMFSMYFPVQIFIQCRGKARHVIQHGITSLPQSSEADAAPAAAGPAASFPFVVTQKSWNSVHEVLSAIIAYYSWLFNAAWATFSGAIAAVGDMLGTTAGVDESNCSRDCNLAGGASKLTE